MNKELRDTLVAGLANLSEREQNLREAQYEVDKSRRELVTYLIRLDQPDLLLPNMTRIRQMVR